MPEMPDDFVNTVSERYIELYEKITGESFGRADTNRINTRVEANIADWIETNL